MVVVARVHVKSGAGIDIWRNVDVEESEYVGSVTILVLQ